MSVFINVGKHIMLDHLAGEIDAISLHSAEPNSSGSNEISGGDPAYSRETPSFGAAASGEVALDTAIEFDIPPSTTVAWVGFWATIEATPTFVAKAALADSEAFSAQGTFTLTTATRLRIVDPD